MAFRRLAAAFLVLSPVGAVAQSPTAIVEDVNSKSAGVEFMDYLSPNQVIRLAPNETLVLGYLKSCWRETISAGTVTVGIEQSDVKDGKVERTKVSCNAGKINLSSAQAQKSGAMAFRAPPKKGAVPPPEFTVFGLSPLVEARSTGQLVIERLDQSGEKFEIEIAGPQFVRGTYFDLAKTGTVLSAGGIYRASFGDKQAVFKVDAFAKPGAAPVIGRLLRLSP